jgi:hypothetical protein
LADLLQILVGYGREGYSGNVQLVLLNEIQKQIQRAGEDGQLNPVSRRLLGGRYSRWGWHISGQAMVLIKA